MRLEEATRALGVTDQGDKKSPKRVIAIHRTKRGRTYYTKDAKASFVNGRALPVVDNR
jgi:hypothetical protein